MLQVLKSKRFLAIAAAVAVVAFLVGVGLNMVLGQLLALPDGAELPDAPLASVGSDGGGTSASASRPARSETTYSRPIMKRNIFDHTQIGLEPSGGGGGTDGAKTDIKAILIATVVSTEPIYSSALIVGEGKDSAPSGYGMGDNLMGEGTIVAIHQKRVYIDRGGGIVEYLEMEEDVPTSGSSTAKKTKKGDDEGISKDGDVTVVERAVVDEALENVDKLATKMRVVPHKGTDGEIDGYRLSAVRRGSLFDKLGIKNGDIVHAVNGMPLTSTDGAFGAYQTLQSESSFSFEVTRRNKKQTFQYEIR